MSPLLFASNQKRFNTLNITNISAWVAVVMTYASVTLYAGDVSLQSVSSHSKHSLCQVSEQTVYFSVTPQTCVRLSGFDVVWHKKMLWKTLTRAVRVTGLRHISRFKLHFGSKPPSNVAWIQLARIPFCVFFLFVCLFLLSNFPETIRFHQFGYDLDLPSNWFWAW